MWIPSPFTNTVRLKFYHQLPNTPSFSSASLHRFAYPLVFVFVGGWRVLCMDYGRLPGWIRKTHGTFHVHSMSATTALYPPSFPGLLYLWHCRWFPQTGRSSKQRTIRASELPPHRIAKLNTATSPGPPICQIPYVRQFIRSYVLFPEQIDWHRTSSNQRSRAFPCDYQVWEGGVSRLGPHLIFWCVLFYWAPNPAPREQ